MERKSIPKERLKWEIKMKTYKLVIHFIGGERLILNNLETEQDRDEFMGEIEEFIFKQPNTIYRHEYKNVVYNINCNHITYTELLEC